MSTLPTILDLMVQTKSLNKPDTDVALDLMNEYEGQSLIRPFRETQNGRHAWHFGVINTGGTFLSVDDASVPYRLIVPMTDEKEFAFTNLDTDPYEQNLIYGFNVREISRRVRRKVGNDAANWVFAADKLAKWWIADRRRLYNFNEEEDFADNSGDPNGWLNWS